MGVRVFVINRPINRNEVGFPLEPKDTGAILEYFHVVRDEEAGSRVRAIRFEADRESLKAALTDIGSKVAEEYDLTDFECFRRIGDVAAGEPCLLVRMGGRQGRAVFRAMQEFLDQIRDVEIKSTPVH